MFILSLKSSSLRVNMFTREGKKNYAGRHQVLRTQLFQQKDNFVQIVIFIFNLNYIEQN